jgi:hypothetical protein
MTKLNLNFLSHPAQNAKNLITILDEYGQEIRNYAKEYLTYTITTTNTPSVTAQGIGQSFSLYILVPEISYEYRAIEVEFISFSKVKITLFTLVTSQSEPCIVDISNGLNNYDNKLSELLNTNLFQEILKFLVNQVNLKREYNMTLNIRSKIRLGEARVALLKNGQKMNVGWEKIDGNEVVYYTGKGLREMFKPNMSKEEQEKAAKLKLLSEEELIKQQYKERRNIDEFEDIL